MYLIREQMPHRSGLPRWVFHPKIAPLLQAVRRASSIKNQTVPTDINFLLRRYDARNAAQSIHQKAASRFMIVTFKCATIATRSCWDEGHFPQESIIFTPLLLIVPGPSALVSTLPNAPDEHSLQAYSWLNQIWMHHNILSGLQSSITAHLAIKLTCSGLINVGFLL